MPRFIMAVGRRDVQHINHPYGRPYRNPMGQSLPHAKCYTGTYGKLTILYEDNNPVNLSMETAR
jgi:hypothetical protein